MTWLRLVAKKLYALVFRCLWDKLEQGRHNFFENPGCWRPLWAENFLEANEPRLFAKMGDDSFSRINKRCKCIFIYRWQMRACPKPIKSAERYIKNQIYSVPGTCDDLSFSPKMKSCLWLHNMARTCWDFWFFHVNRKRWKFSYIAAASWKMKGTPINKQFLKTLTLHFYLFSTMQHIAEFL